MLMGLAYVNLEANVDFLKRTPIAKERYFSMKLYLPDLVAKYLQLRSKHDGVLVASLWCGTPQYMPALRRFRLTANQFLFNIKFRLAKIKGPHYWSFVWGEIHRWPLVPHKKARYTESVPTSSCILPRWCRGTPYRRITWEPVWMF